MTKEPTIAVGLVDNAESVSLALLGEFVDTGGRRVGPGRYRITCSGETLCCSGDLVAETGGLSLCAVGDQCRFGLQVTIGIDFHWQQEQLQTFSGALRILPRPGNRVTAINDVPLESYILSVSCSEMSANSPEEFLKAHSIISRSWLLAQLASKRTSPQQPDPASGREGEIMRWYDRRQHEAFDVCADDHCQRYQGTGMITTGVVSSAVGDTRGMVLTHDGEPCDARFSKCCGGITEDFRLAWGETRHPYLVPVFDGAGGGLPDPPLSHEDAARAYVAASPDVFCNCTDDSVLERVLNNYDRTTHDFFRWRVRLTPEDIAALLARKLSLDLGRILALEPVERGLSARLKRLRIVGDKATVVIGKELEIRRALSPTHLYSSAFVVDAEGPAHRPDVFILTGAGWGHGVGLCQIGAAAMACRGIGYREILRHYYPGSVLERVYQ